MSVIKKKKKKIFYLILGGLLLISIFLNTFLLLKYKVLPTKYLLVYFVVVGIIPILMVFYTLFRKRKSKIKAFFSVIEIIYIIVLFIVFFYLNSTFNFLDKFTSDLGYETKEYDVLVLKDSDYKNIKELNEKKIGYTKGLDTSIDEALKELNKKVDSKNVELNGYGELFNGLNSNNIDALLISHTYYETIIENEKSENEDDKVSQTTNSTYDKYRILYTFKIAEKTVELTKEVNVISEPFNIYITGIDTYGEITEKNRSDVNIIMSVNPKTNKIVLVNIPRDYYVDLAGTNSKDKLTHAGIYGVDTSIKTIQNLLDVDINYYIKLNYNALIKIVDALGGVDVYSEHKFTSGQLFVHFNEGMNHVNGKEALEFVRTRKAFLQGDRVRGENQQRMIQAIFKKASSPSILIKYDSILKSLEGNFVTNIKTEDIMSLVNMQLDKMPSWEFSSISLNGSDAHELTYSYPGQELYVMIPNEESVNEAKKVLSENAN